MLQFPNNSDTPKNQSGAHQYEQIIHQIPKNKVQNSIQALLDLHPKSKYKNPSTQRDKYSKLFNWYQSQLTFLLNENKSDQVMGYSVMQKQFELQIIAMEKLKELSFAYCQEKGLLMETLLKQQISIHNIFTQYMDNKVRNTLQQCMEDEISLQINYENKIKQLENELHQLSNEKDKKWKNMFMLIKDNRILRRQRGKILRELNNAHINQAKLEQKLSFVIRQNQRYKMVLSDNYYDDNQFQKWSKVLINMINYERTLKKYPTRAKKILQFDLQNLQILEMKSIQEKMEYMIKAIEEADEIVEYYQDLNEVALPSKLLLNNCTQTDIEYEEKGINTNSTKSMNVYCQVKKSELKANYLSIMSNVSSSCIQPKISLSASRFNRKQSFTSGASSIPKKKYIMPQSNCKLKKNASQIQRNFEIQSAFNISRIYHFQISRLAEQKLSLQIMGQRIRSLKHTKNVIQIFYDTSNFDQTKQKPHQVIKKKRESIESSFTNDEEDLMQILDKSKKTPKQRLSHNFGQKNNRNKRLSAAVKTNQRLSFTSNFDKISNLQGINQIEETEEQKNSEVDTQLNTLITNEYVNNKNHNNKWKESPSKFKNKNSNYRTNQENQLLKNQEQQQQLSSVGKIPLKTSKSPKILISEHKSQKTKILRTNRNSKKSDYSLNIFSGFQNQKKRIVTENNQRSILQESQSECKAIQEFQSVIAEQNNKNRLDSTRKNLLKLTKFRGSMIGPQSPSINIKEQRHYEQKHQRQSLNVFQNRANTSEKKKNQLKQIHNLMKTGRSTAQKINMQGRISKRQQNIQIPFYLKDKKAQKSVKRIQTTPCNYFQSEEDIGSCHVDSLKIIQKVIHLLYVHKQELRYTSKTLKQFVQNNLKFLFGYNPQYQLTAFNKLLALQKQPNSTIQCFRKLLSSDYPLIYLSDLLKVYIIMMDRSGTESLIVEKDKAFKIIEFMFSMFYNKEYYDKLIDQLPYMNKININLNDFFIFLEANIRKDGLQSEIYIYLRKIIPGNQTNLNFMQLTQITKFLPENEETQKNLARIRFYCYRDSKNLTNIGMKIHKISLYLSLYSWDDLKYIQNTISKKWYFLNSQKLSDICDQCQKQQLITEIQTRKLNQFKRFFFYQLQNENSSKFLLKNQCPWLYSLAIRHFYNHVYFNTPLCQNFIIHLQLTEYELKTRKLNIFPTNLQIISEQYKKLAVRLQIKDIIGKN